MTHCIREAKISATRFPPPGSMSALTSLPTAIVECAPQFGSGRTILRAPRAMTAGTRERTGHDQTYAR